MNDTPDRTKGSKGAAQRDTTRARIREAALQIVGRDGFDAKVEDIAQLAGVSARTIFRHYESHDQLIAATVKDIYEECGLPPLVENVTEQLDEVSRTIDGLDEWIDFVALAFHTRSAEIFGAAFWDIHGPRRRDTEALAHVAVLRHQYRVRGVDHFVRLTWQKAGGVGDPPEDLVLAYALHLSAFTTQALTVDFDRTPTEIAALVADILKVITRRAVAAQRFAAPFVAGTRAAPDRPPSAHN